MIILSHRGYWKTPEEKNTPEAFQRSFRLGFGTETDVRDLNGTLVISHDPPTTSALTLEAMLAIYREHDPTLPLALNIKSDGLAVPLKTALEAAGVTHYFVFDMSVPDTRPYLGNAMPVFTRHSEYEPTPPFYDRAAGVWMDAFESDWIGVQHVLQHLQHNKSVCLVSPDLHRRPHQAVWEAIRAWGLPDTSRLMLCTDYPEEAKELFDGMH